MADFYIVPPRLTVGTFDRANVVNSINSLKGDLSFVADPNSGVRILVSGDVLQFSIAQDYYVKKSGDTYTKNLLFRPDNGFYGLAVGFGSTTPGIGVTGSLYFDVTTGLLNVHDGTTWNPISGNGIPQAAADLRYLKLDGTNTPTSNISMGSFFLRLANLPTQSLAGTAGQLYFNTTTGLVNIYNGSQWTAVGLGITSITLGNGLYSATNPITTSGTIAVDQAANFTWTGSHVFNNPVTFAAAGQSFDISKLYISGQTQGDIIFFDSGAWTRFGIGSVSQALVVNSSGTGLTWGTAIGGGGGSGISYLNNLTSGIQDFAVGFSGNTFNISSFGATHTFNIPIAGTGATGLVSTLAQTFAGEKTFTNGIVGNLSGTSTTSQNVNIVDASSNTNHPLVFTPTSGTSSGAALSSDSTLVFNSNTNLLSVSGVAITGGTASTNSSTGALVVDGGVGIGGSLFVAGDLTVNGQLTTINSTIVTVYDKNIELAYTGSPTDTYAEGGGITLKGTTDKILAWYAGTGWSVNQSFNLSSGNEYKIDNTSVLSSSTLGTGVTNSSLTSVGTISSGVWAGTSITSKYGGTGFTTYNKGDLLAGSGSSLVILPVGSNSYVLTANSTQTSGLAWTAASTIGTTTVGSPTDGSINDGFFTAWTSATSIADAFDDVSELLALIAPARPSYLTGTSLSATSTPTYYTVRISAGLGTEWYQAGFGTASSITRYYLSGAHTLSTANTSTTFSAGSLTTSTYGTIYFNRYNSTVPAGGGVGTIDLTTNYAINFTSNNLKLTALGIYNSIWTKANAQISAYTQPNPGYEGVYIAHSENSQYTNTYEMWKDPWSASNPNPVFSQSATASTYSQTLRYLSGIGYYTTGTGFSVYFKGAAGIYSSCYNTTQVYAISATGLVTSTGTASSPLYTDELDKSGSNHVRVALNSSSASSFNKYVTATIYKAHGTTAASNATIGRAINTYGTISTDTFEGFQDEARRLVIGTGIAFTSTIDMASGNLQVRSGSLTYPISADYDTEWGGTHTFTGDQEYQRYFYKTSASTGTLTFAGFTASNIAAYGTGSVNVLLYLEGDNKYFDLGVLQGSNANDGSSRAAAISAKTSASSGALDWSLGVYTTGVSGAGNSGRYRAIVIYRDNTYTMTSITSS